MHNRGFSIRCWFRLAILAHLASLPLPLLAQEALVLDGYGQPIRSQATRPTVRQAPSAQNQDPYLGDYLSRIQARITDARPPMQERLPAEYLPWWQPLVVGENGNETLLRVDLDRLIVGALQHSPHVQVVNLEPAIYATVVDEARAGFDWRTYLESTYSSTNDPVGNTLTTGNADDRFRDRNWTTRGGFRRTNARGGEFDVSQRLAGQENNSLYLLPNPQATTRLELQYTQPLLQGGGRPYNLSRVVLAEIGLDAAGHKQRTQIERHLVQVSEAYWNLYRSRAEFFQRCRLLQAAETALAILEGRERVDAVQRQVMRARAAVANRRSEIVRAETSIRNSEAKLRLLVGDPELAHSTGRVLTPQEPPQTEPFACELSEALHTALVNRADIAASIREMRSAAVRLGVARHEILPQLDLIASTYVAGLAPQTDIGSSLGDQFSSRPGYSVGLQFEVPLGNRAALAARERRDLELSRSVGEFRVVVEESLTQVEIACREVQASYSEMLGKHGAMQAVSDEATYLFDRWRTLPGIDDSAATLLENLLEAQERLAAEEAAFVGAQVGYALAIVRLKQEMGTLLNCSSCEPEGCQVESPAEQSEPPASASRRATLSR